jgi:photosystem II Psb28-2 protein
MTALTPQIEFFDGIHEDLSNISLRRDRNTGMRIVVLMFEQLRSVEQFNSYRRRFANALRLTDSEGEINVTPSSVQFVFGGPEGDDLQRVECKIELDQEAHWERLMRFLQRYAEANDMEYREPPSHTDQ